MANNRYPQPLTLNLLIHGGFAFAQEEKKITIYLPKGDQHVFRVGSWLAETELGGVRELNKPGMRYKLLGIDDNGTDGFTSETNLMVKDQKVKPDLTQAFAALELPRPREVTSLRAIDIPRDLFGIKPPGPPVELEGDGTTLRATALQVLTYDIKDQNQLKLVFQDNQKDGHYWEPLLAGNYINLHMFCSEDHHQTINPARDLEECASLLGFPQLELDTRSLPSDEIPDTDSLPDGVVAEETESLPQRTQRLARLGSLIRQKGDANLAWTENDALNDDPAVCYPFGGRCC
jgi:hypothetical protein